MNKEKKKSGRKPLPVELKKKRYVFYMTDNEAVLFMELLKTQIPTFNKFKND